MSCSAMCSGEMHECVTCAKFFVIYICIYIYIMRSLSSLVYSSLFLSRAFEKSDMCKGSCTNIVNTLALKCTYIATTRKRKYVL